MCRSKFDYEDLKIEDLEPYFFVIPEVHLNENEVAGVEEEDPIGFLLDNMSDKEIERRAREFQGPNYQPPEDEPDDDDEFMVFEAEKEVVVEKAPVEKEF